MVDFFEEFFGGLGDDHWVFGLILRGGAVGEDDDTGDENGDREGDEYPEAVVDFKLEAAL